MRTRRSIGGGSLVRVGLFGLVVSSCVGPSRAQLAEREMEARRIMQARAVHMPPKGTEPCVGVTVRLTEENDGAAREREALALRLPDATVRELIERAGLGRCRQAYVDGIEESALSPEPLSIRLGFGIDPEGLVCAVVERDRPEPIDAGTGPLIEDAARCAKDVLFRAQFPKGLVKDKERIVKFLSLSVDPASVEPDRDLSTRTSSRAGS